MNKRPQPLEEPRSRPSNTRQRIAQMLIPLALTACDPADSQNKSQDAGQVSSSSSAEVIGPDPVVDLEWRKENTVFRYYKQNQREKTVEMDREKCKRRGGRVVYDKYRRSGGSSRNPYASRRTGIGKSKCAIKYPGMGVKAKTRTLSEINPETDREELEQFIQHSRKDPQLQLEAIKMYCSGEIHLSSSLFRNVTSEQGQLLLIENFDDSNDNYSWAAELTECSPYAKNDEVKKTIENKIGEIAKKLTKEEVASLTRVQAMAEDIKATEDRVSKKR